ncbi:MAG TPA: DUF1573 domain-containing protein [Verrucomicrobiae bacterium]
MSSKGRKTSGGRGPQQPAYRSSVASGKGSGGHKKSGKAWIAAIFVALIATLVVYAVQNKNKPEQTPAGAKSPARIAGPQIQFASMVYNFGKAKGDDLVNCVFYYTNIGTALLELTDVTPSCSCLKLGDWTRKLNPGQSGSISVQYDSHYHTGPFAKSLFVTCNDPAQPKPTMLEIKGDVYRPIEIWPPWGVVNVNPEMPSNSALVKITSHLEKPMAITNVESDNKLIALEVSETQPGKEFELLVKTAPGFPNTPQTGHATLKTDSPDAPVINIDTRVNVTQLILAIPQMIKLPPGPLTNVQPYEFRVRNNSSNALTLTEPMVADKAIVAEIKEEDPGKQYALTLQFPAGFEVPAGQPGELSVKTGHPKMPVLKLPILQDRRIAP